MLKTVCSQLDWRSNQSQDLILFENGKPLSDFSDPQNQARCWIDDQANVLRNDPKIIVVGAGSGYHLQELAKAYPYSEITAIDCRIQVTSFLARKYPHISFVFFDSLTELVKSPRLRDMMKGDVLKLKFAPSFGVQQKLLEEMFYFLNLRTSEALSAYLEREVIGQDHVLINMRHLFENAKITDLPYRMSEILTLQEIIK